jgi:ubiquinone/menaquinone biosynthesis C-methylase UbiE
MPLSPPPSTFDQYAERYDATVQAAIGASGESVAFFAELKARLAREVAPDARRILDVGCGIGNVTRALARAFPAAIVTGSDPSPESIAIARSHPAPAVDFARSEANVLPFPDASFDLVIAACVFHHIAPADRVASALEIRRVLRPGGRFVLFEHNPLNPLTRRVVRNVPFDEGVVLLPMTAGRRLMRDAGLRVSRQRFYFFFPRLLRALRRLEPALGWLPAGAQYYVVGER